MIVHLIDGTYELFRHFYAVPPARDRNGDEVAAVRGVVGSLRGMLNSGVATHIGVATDHVIESFRNDLYPGYKTGEGIDPNLLSQFPLLEQALEAFGVVVWPMIEYEADDALAAAAVKAAADPRVTQVRICTPDKDLSQCVSGTRIVQEDRLRRTTRDEAGVIAKFGVAPASIPDYLALVGDTSDGYPGLAGLGREVGGGRAREVQAHRTDSRGLANLGRELRAAGSAVDHAGEGSRAGAAVPRPRDAAHQHRGVRLGRSTRMAGTEAGLPGVEGALRFCEGRVGPQDQGAQGRRRHRKRRGST